MNNLVILAVLFVNTYASINLYVQGKGIHYGFTESLR